MNQKLAIPEHIEILYNKICHMFGKGNTVLLSTIGNFIKQSVQDDTSLCNGKPADIIKVYELLDLMKITRGVVGKDEAKIL
jgi:hypothetical protein